MTLSQKLFIYLFILPIGEQRSKLTLSLQVVLSLLTMASTSSSTVPSHPVIFTTQTPYALPSQKFMIPLDWKRYQLSQLINKALDLPKPIPFDFLVHGEILRTSLWEWRAERGVGEVSQFTDMFERGRLIFDRKTRWKSNILRVSCLHSACLTFHTRIGCLRYHAEYLSTFPKRT